MSLNLRMGELEDYKKHIKEDMVMLLLISLCKRERGVCFVHCAHCRRETHVKVSNTNRTLAQSAYLKHEFLIS